jgi:thioredoxin-related protein
MSIFRTAITLVLVGGVACALAQQSVSAAVRSEAVVAKPRPASVEALLAKAKDDAKKGGKNVLVLFHASWCQWCHRLDEFMDNPKIKPIFEENFVPVRITVLENDKHKADENPGGLEEMEDLGGKDAGLPFFAILNTDGRPLTSSIRPPAGSDKGGNTGFPAAPEEVDHFLQMMKLGAPKITAEQLDLMKEVLTAKP